MHLETSASVHVKVVSWDVWNGNNRHCVQNMGHTHQPAQAPSLHLYPKRRFDYTVNGNTSESDPKTRHSQWFGSFAHITHRQLDKRRRRHERRDGAYWVSFKLDSLLERKMEEWAREREGRREKDRVRDTRGRVVPSCCQCEKKHVLRKKKQDIWRMSRVLHHGRQDTRLD